MAGGLGPIDLTIVGAYFAAVLVTFLLALGVVRLLFRTGPAERALFGMGSIFSNTVLLAIPLIYTALGEAAGRQLMLIIARSEEHTSELQSLMRSSYAVFCLNKKTQIRTTT